MADKATIYFFYCLQRLCSQWSLLKQLKLFDTKSLIKTSLGSSRHSVRLDLRHFGPRFLGRSNVEHLSRGTFKNAFRELEQKNVLSVWAFCPIWLYFR